MNDMPAPLDRYVQYSHDTARACLVLCLLAALLFLFRLVPGMEQSGTMLRVPVLFPFAIAAAIAWLHVRGKTLGVKPGTPLWRAMFRDELRQRNISRAVREALVVTLAAQPILACAMQEWFPDLGVWGMAGVTCHIGASTYFACFLLHEGRDQ